jgi:small neutral amino acid transporter SnatA (MarC family)
LLWNTYLIAFSTLLSLINSLGSALVFLRLVGEAPSAALSLQRWDGPYYRVGL